MLCVFVFIHTLTLVVAKYKRIHAKTFNSMQMHKTPLKVKQMLTKPFKSMQNPSNLRN